MAKFWAEAGGWGCELVALPNQLTFYKRPCGKKSAALALTPGTQRQKSFAHEQGVLTFRQLPAAMTSKGDLTGSSSDRLSMLASRRLYRIHCPDRARP